MAVPSAHWVANHFKGNLANPKVERELLSGCLDYGRQFGIINTEDQAKEFFQSSTPAIVKNSFASTLNPESLSHLLRGYGASKGKRLPTPSRIAAASQAGLFEDQPKQVRLAARTTVQSGSAGKSLSSASDFIQEAISYGLTLGVLPPADAEGNFLAHAANCFRDHDDTESGSAILASILADYTRVVGF